MPIREYVPDAACLGDCGGRFECLQSLDAPALEKCPQCGAPCHRVVSAAAVVTGGAHRLKESHLGRHGFTQYRKVGKGKYEKTVGQGPDTIEG
jgi:putative FmdB family regulatory protein